MSESARRSPDWDLRAGTSNYFVVVNAYALVALLSLASTYVVTRALDPQHFGRLIALLAASHLAQQIGVSWTALSLV